jgi:hypothetical protein
MDQTLDPRTSKFEGCPRTWVKLGPGQMSSVAVAAVLWGAAAVNAFVMTPPPVRALPPLAFGRCDAPPPLGHFLLPPSKDRRGPVVAHTRHGGAASKPTNMPKPVRAEKERG